MYNPGDALQGAVVGAVEWSILLGEICRWIDSEVVCDRREDDDGAQEEESQEREEDVKCPSLVHCGAKGRR